MTRPVKLMIFGGAVLAVSIAIAHSHSTAARPNPAEEQRWDAALGGAVALRREMRNPDSFKVTRAIERADGGVCYEYRAQNGFGGMNVERAIITPHRVIDESERDFSGLWNYACSGESGRDLAAKINAALKLAPEQ